MQCNAVEMESGMGEEKIEEMPVDINSKCPSIVSWNGIGGLKRPATPTSATPLMA
jgi:hypothetical protein